MTEAEIFASLNKIFRAVMSDDSIVLTKETSQRDIEKWDSFRYVEIILEIEQALGVKIRAREANKLQNVGELVDLIQSKLPIG